jgi:hypothetical protein
MELLFLALLQVKHWYIDFVIQTDKEVANKGIYLNWFGIQHSLKHGIATLAITLIFLPIFEALILGAIDFFLHYHIDYCKMRFGTRNIKTKAFWLQLGLDQMLHQLTYLGIIWLVTI